MGGGAMSAARIVEIAPAAFDVANLFAAYGPGDVLRGVRASIPARAVTAVMGPSGCGKSTFVKVLNRTLELTAGARVCGGRVGFAGQDLYARGVDPHDIRRRIGLIHQRPIPFPMSVLENVLFGARFHGLVTNATAEACARRCLERVGLWDEVQARLHEPASRLSGGQQQRLCLARTLAVEPEALLMDEPCSALDPKATARIEALMRELSRDYPVVVVTHNLAQARRVADHVLFFFEGERVEEGPAERLFQDPQHPVTREFVTGRIG
jgi:phosphate transport system ATP-binding protein